MSGGRLRVLELYCGIGGLAAALEPAAAEIVAAVDVNRLALGVYSLNYPGHPVVPAVVESLTADHWRRWDADLWWMSPPCQPFTRRGRGRDLDDPRTAGFVAILDQLETLRPSHVGLENVPPFRHSRARDRLLRVLERAGYGSILETVLCPTELGIPNRRRRYYLVASRTAELSLLPTPLPAEVRPLASYLERRPSPELDVDPELAARYEGALDVVDAEDPNAVTACFTSAYGRSPVRSGSYLAPGSKTAIRRFSPAEILRLLDFPPEFRMPASLPRSNAWRLAGNSLSLPPVRTVLAAIPGLARLLLGRAGGVQTVERQLLDL